MTEMRALQSQLKRNILIHTRNIQNRCCSNEFVYAEQIQKAQIKPPEFYHNQAEHKNYFYHVDLQGRLFLEDILPKNIATSLKSDKFLRFFFNNLRVNNLEEFDEYPFISPCGKEMNFIRPADTPICFNEIQGEKLLYAGGTLEEDFQPDQLHLCEKTNRLYHPIRKHKRMKGHLALLSSHLAISLSSTFENLETEQVGFRHGGRVYPLQSIDTTAKIRSK